MRTSTRPWHSIRFTERTKLILATAVCFGLSLLIIGQISIAPAAESVNHYDSSTNWQGFFCEDK